jgi:ribosomal protein S18 acetylase RimI-like enzyme
VGEPLPARVEIWHGREFAARIDEAMDIYVRAMGYTPDTGRARGLTARRHIVNEGFACRAAVRDDGTLVGFGYGYTTLPGQWWHDIVRKALPRSVAEEWLTNAFELSELHVMPGHQGQGLGRALLTSLARDLPHAAILLSTPDSDTRAFRLYRDLGFLDLRRQYLFPGDSRPFAVLGLRLPLPAAYAPRHAD